MAYGTCKSLPIEGQHSTEEVPWRKLSWVSIQRLWFGLEYSIHRPTDTEGLYKSLVYEFWENYKKCNKKSQKVQLSQKNQKSQKFKINWKKPKQLKKSNKNIKKCPKSVKKKF